MASGTEPVISPCCREDVACVRRTCGFAGGEDGFDGLATTRLRIDLSRFFTFLLFGFVFAIVMLWRYLRCLIAKEEFEVLILLKFVNRQSIFLTGDRR